VGREKGKELVSLRGCLPIAKHQRHQLSNLVRNHIKPNFDLQYKIEKLETFIKEAETMINCYKLRIKKLKEDNEWLNTTLKKYKGITKGLLTILHEAGIMKEKQSLLTLFKDVIPLSSP
jgi:hypothetical protein